MKHGDTFRAALGGLIATRFALFGLELRDEIDRAALMVGLAIAAALALLLAISFGGLALLFGFWPYRIWVCAGVGLLFLALGLWAWWKMRHFMHLASDPFPLTSEEFAQDRKLLDAAFSAPKQESSND
ncbi:phage holin family protein [Chitinibacter sp. S2-10]|uniref:phage holin family protein n=1 Tax=Chitinibacter sp. S2-10 TaxID=3373597 RepID=UPI003977911E